MIAFVAHCVNFQVTKIVDEDTRVAKQPMLVEGVQQTGWKWVAPTITE